MTPDDYPRCRTCKWWGNRQFQHIGERTVCLLATPWNGDAGMEVNTDGFMAIRGPKFAALVTGPDYGCVHHQDKGRAMRWDSLIQADSPQDAIARAQAEMGNLADGCEINVRHCGNDRYVVTLTRDEPSPLAERVKWLEESFQELLHMLDTEVCNEHSYVRRFYEDNSKG